MALTRSAGDIHHRPRLRSYPLCDEYGLSDVTLPSKVGFRLRANEDSHHHEPGCQALCETIEPNVMERPSTKSVLGQRNSVVGGSGYFNRSEITDHSGSFWSGVHRNTWDTHIGRLNLEPLPFNRLLSLTQMGRGLIHRTHIALCNVMALTRYAGVLWLHTHTVRTRNPLVRASTLRTIRRGYRSYG